MDDTFGANTPGASDQMSPHDECEDLLYEIQALIHKYLREDVAQRYPRLELEGVYVKVESLLRRYKQYFAKIKDVVVNPVRSWKKTLQALAEIDMMDLEWRLRYIIGNKERFALPYEGRGSHDQNFARLAIAHRIKWLLNQRALGHDVTSLEHNTPGSLRYNTSVWRSDADSLRDSLPQQYKWLLDYEKPLNMEWNILALFVGPLTAWEFHCFETLQFAQDGNRKPQLEEIMKSRSTAATEEEKRRENPDCPVCMKPYSQKTDQNHEQAVKTSCNHILGEKCLFDWIQSQYPRIVQCPTCRRPLFGEIDYFASSSVKSMRVLALEYTAFFSKTPALERRVDSFLMESREEDLRKCYEPSVGQMLEELRERFEYGMKMRAEFHARIPSLGKGEK